MFFNWIRSYPQFSAKQIKKIYLFKAENTTLFLQKCVLEYFQKIN